ncbi:FHA domain-containing protein [Streptomyces sp. NPDC049879]|uniref:FHA domain-containing protein n=1 Tax=Streptomyces sp. NPDC049879 TaxID=3365598 RepID=UPI003792A12D
MSAPFAYERHLTDRPERADALVDLSDVVRDARLGPPGARSLDRLRLVVQALGDRLRDRWVTVHAIAGQGLRAARTEYPDRLDIDRLERLAKSGLVTELPDADGPLLDIAGMTGLPVIGRGTYAAHRAGHPWLQGNTTQFLAPRPAPGRTAHLVERDMGVVPGHARPAGPPRTPLPDIVARHWRCPERTCSLYDRRRGEAVLLPRLHDGAPVCEWHHVPLADDGPRVPVAQLKLLHGHGTVHRFHLDAGTRAVLGRAADDAGGTGRVLAVDGLLPPAETARIADRHLEIRVAPDAVRLLDLSGGRTRLWRPGPGGGGWTRLSGERSTVLRVTDVVEPVPGVTLARGGRRLPAEIAEEWRRAAARADHHDGE